MTGVFTIGDLTFLSTSFRACATRWKNLFFGFSNVAGQALYLDDLLFRFSASSRRSTSLPNPLPFPQPMREGFVFENVGFRYPGAERWALRNLDFRLQAGEVLGPGRREWRGQDHAREASVAALLIRT